MLGPMVAVWFIIALCASTKQHHAHYSTVIGNANQWQGSALFRSVEEWGRSGLLKCLDLFVFCSESLFCQADAGKGCCFQLSLCLCIYLCVFVTSLFLCFYLSLYQHRVGHLSHRMGCLVFIPSSNILTLHRRFELECCVCLPVYVLFYRILRCELSTLIVDSPATVCSTTTKSAFLFFSEL